ncbi:OmpH family outer membrane protein [Chlamydia suis]|uniref:OmpH family outer membrane protein n=2 Tax=Chlamydia suis TaxID=83559 RepID=A0AAQ0EMZ1_9CHLA|nr:OmpH family outer membrane protein [Chlamydia suis]MEB2681053.1 OmpH family outer membrane protein [Chlamydia suis]MEB2682077.1 OmpH family outer membrane protein [Chlamydia suis]MEB2683000.1 OmpH family outer membrane protein [Chlamydia suis]MEB2683761.1 OmpH family outer membrane protein [Chlamydia suis]MEB2684814.1 OmpH family outer membrane protein [Chlamydia suis]
MKKFLLFISLSLVSSPTFAASSTSTIGIVNLRRCLEESALGKKESAEFEKMKKQFSNSMGKMEEELSSIYSKLQDDDYMEGLSESAATELRKKFEELSAEYNTAQGQYYQILNQSNLKRMQKIMEEVKKASEIVRVQEGLSALLNEDVVLAVDASADKTDDIIKILDDSFQNN